MWAKNKHAPESSWQSPQKSAWKAGGELLHIPEGNLLLLYDHPEECNKIQDHCKY